MPVLPSDILKKINSLFLRGKDREEASYLLSGLWNLSLNVGPEQLSRSILILSYGDIEEVKEIIAKDFFGDPRDVIMMAEAELDNPGHYGNIPFEDF